ncbi:MAG: dual specificity protein phosphatase family protein [Marinomonas sp.]
MLTFQAEMHAQAKLKERIIWLLYLGTVFFLLYGAANEFASLTAPHFSFYFEWEKQIDFIPAFIVPYMSSDLIFVIAFLLPQTRLELRVLALRVLFIVLISVMIFIAFPLEFSFTKPSTESYAFLFKLLEADKPFNQLPSLHVSFAIVFWFSMKETINNHLIKAVLLSWLLLVIASTLLVYQHHFIDLPTGALVGILAVLFIRENQNKVLITKFMTPRHLKMASYFLALSIGLMVMSFALSPIFLYFFLCCFSVSIIYAFGLNHLLDISYKKARLIRWFILFPYYLGCKLSWMRYKKSLPLVSKVDSGVYLGRHPSIGEYSKINALGVKRVINLATELPLNKTALIQHRFNFLDQTIQCPKAIHKAVVLIEKHKSDGIYVHCALGLSRSVIVIWAWMLFNGKTNEEITEHLNEIRPDYVKSKYMEVNISLYQKYLNSQLT